MISAAYARLISEEIKTKSKQQAVDFDLKLIEEKVMNSVEMGLNHTFIILMFDATKEELIKLGYTVEYNKWFISPRAKIETSCYKISW